MQYRWLQILLVFSLTITLGAGAVTSGVPPSLTVPSVDGGEPSAISPVRRGEDRTVTPRTPEEYRRVVVLSITYGDGPDEVGFVPGGLDQPALGPLAFAVRPSDSSIAILDSVNHRVLGFSRYGAIESTVNDVYGTDLGFVPDGMGVLDTGTATVSFHTRRGQTRVTTVSPEMTRLRIDTSGNIAAVEVGTRQPALAADFVPQIEVLRLDDHRGEIRTSDGRKIDVRTTESFGSIDLVGTDADGNLYVAIEQLLPGPTIDVLKEVRKYSPAGELRAVIPIVIDYAVHPQREFIVDREGNLYHLRPLIDSVVVERWGRP